MDVLGIDVTAAEAGAAYPGGSGGRWPPTWPATRATTPRSPWPVLLEARATARAEKMWAVADGVRNGLADLGFVIEDTPQGARVMFEG